MIAVLCAWAGATLAIAGSLISAATRKEHPVIEGSERQEGSVLLPDGRRLSYARYGQGGGKALLICHGDAQSRLGYRWRSPEAERHGIELICPERPGYGLSDPPARGYRFADWAQDVEILFWVWRYPAIASSHSVAPTATAANTTRAATVHHTAQTGRSQDLRPLMFSP